MPDSKITALTSTGTGTDPAVDPLVIVDVSDTTMAATGTTKKVTLNQLLACSPTATLASATITGALTVGNGTSATQTFNGVTNILDIGFGSLRGGSAYGDVRLWTDRFRIYNNAGTQIIKNISGTNGDETWYDGAGGTRMTLNATGLGVGISPIYKLHVKSDLSELYFRDNGTSSELLINSETGGRSALYFGDVADTVRGGIVYDSATDSLEIRGYNNVARLQIDSVGNVASNVTATAPTLLINSQMVFNLTSNTNLRISVRGTDGVTRTANLTLA